MEDYFLLGNGRTDGELFDWRKIVLTKDTLCKQPIAGVLLSVPLPQRGNNQARTPGNQCSYHQAANTCGRKINR
jgi:hypothetical protein